MRKFILGLRYLYHKLFSGFYHLGWKVVFDDNVKLINPGHISLGKYVTIDPDCMLSVIKNHLNFTYQPQKPAIQIEDYVGISKGTIICALNSIQIKKYVMIGPYCFIGDYDHTYQDISKPIAHQPLTNIHPVVIEEGVWIGAHVTICSGLTIGKNSVIGAGSVVTKDIPSYSVAVGVPAKVIKKYNHKIRVWERINKDKKV